MKKERTIVVIGGSQGGPIAAARAREFNENAKIILIEKQEQVSWIQANLRYHLKGEIAENIEQMSKHRSLGYEKRYNIDIRTDTEVIGLDNDARRIWVQTKKGKERLKYDAVIFAGGAQTPIPNEYSKESTSGFRSLTDLKKIKARIDQGAKTAVIIGAGGYGVDAAGGLIEEGFKVCLIDSASKILPGFSIAAARAAAHMLREKGVRLILNEKVSHLETFEDFSQKLQLSSGEELTADLVIFATGMKARSKLLQAAGASCHKNGTIRVDEKMQTTLPRVYACGTAVSVKHAVTDEYIWTVQNAIIDRTAQIAGRNVAAQKDDLGEVLLPVAGTTLHQVGEHWFARTGVTDIQARSALGDENLSISTVHSWSSERWLGGSIITIRLIIDQQKQRIIGGEAWGKIGAGVPRRIDILAAAVLEEWTPTKLADLDVAYNPQLGPAYDPINAAGTLAQLLIHNQTAVISPADLTLKIAQNSDIQIIDVGTEKRQCPELWPKDKILFIPLEELRKQIDDIDPNKETILVSYTGRRAHIAYRLLKQRQLMHLSFLDGGSVTWRLMKDAAGVPC